MWAHSSWGIPKSKRRKKAPKPDSTKMAKCAAQPRSHSTNAWEWKVRNERLRTAIRSGMVVLPRNKLLDDFWNGDGPPCSEPPDNSLYCADDMLYVGITHGRVQRDGNEARILGNGSRTGIRDTQFPVVRMHVHGNEVNTAPHTLGPHFREERVPIRAELL